MLDRLLYTAEICPEKEEIASLNTENVYVNAGGKMKSRDIINRMGGRKTMALFYFASLSQNFLLYATVLFHLHENASDIRA